MRTSTQLFDACGNAILNYYSQFVLENAAPGDPAEPVKVLVGIVAEGELLAEQRVAFNNFLQIVNQPFSIKTADKVYLNAECAYGESLKKLSSAMLWSCSMFLSSSLLYFQTRLKDWVSN